MQAARLKVDFPPAWPIFYMREEDEELDLSEQVSAARAADLKERSHFIKYKRNIERNKHSTKRLESTTSN